MLPDIRDCSGTAFNDEDKRKEFAADASRTLEDRADTIMTQRTER